MKKRTLQKELGGALENVKRIKRMIKETEKEEQNGYLKISKTQFDLEDQNKTALDDALKAWKKKLDTLPKLSSLKAPPFFLFIFPHRYPAEEEPESDQEEDEENTDLLEHAYLNMWNWDEYVRCPVYSRPMVFHAEKEEDLLPDKKDAELLNKCGCFFVVLPREWVQAEEVDIDDISTPNSIIGSLKTVLKGFQTGNNTKWWFLPEDKEIFVKSQKRINAFFDNLYHICDAFKKDQGEYDPRVRPEIVAVQKQKNTK